MAPYLCTICFQVPHWLASLPWDSGSSGSESDTETGAGSGSQSVLQTDYDYAVNNPTVTLGSWRWITAQAEAAVERKENRDIYFEWWKGAGGEEEGVGGKEEGRNEMNAMMRGGPVGGIKSGAGGINTMTATTTMATTTTTTTAMITTDMMKGGPAGPVGPLRAGKMEEEEEEEEAAKRENRNSKGCDICLMIMHAPHRASCCKYDLRPYYLPPEMDPRKDERYADVPLVFGREGRRRVSGGEMEYRMTCLNAPSLGAGLVAKVAGGWCKFVFVLVLFPFFFPFRSLCPLSWCLRFHIFSRSMWLWGSRYLCWMLTMLTETEYSSSLHASPGIPRPKPRK